jgi:UDP-GlcNAc:undecaprenyl-phosphate GlcNAc-1-phosphate transferase
MLERWLAYTVTFALALGLACWLTPHLREAAIRFGIVDRPDGRLKTHREPVAYLGGLAIYLAFLLAIAVTFRFSEPVLGVLLGGSIVVILGLIDDLGQLGPWTKLAGQLVAVSVLIKSGIHVKLVFIHPALALAISVVWLLAVTNAFNLIDVMDGLSAGTAAIAALVLLVVADLGGSRTSAMLLAGLAGACLGFLRYNFEPARIYMGDTGSLFIGLVLGALTMDLAYTKRHHLGAVAPGLILGLPLFDMLFVMYVRYRRGLPVMLGSPDHVALRLRRWRLTTRQTVLVSYGATGALGLVALAMIELPVATAGSLLALTLLAALGLGLWLRRIEMGL